MLGRNQRRARVLYTKAKSAPVECLISLKGSNHNFWNERRRFELRQHQWFLKDPSFFNCKWFSKPSCTRFCRKEEYFWVFQVGLGVGREISTQLIAVFHRTENSGLVPTLSVRMATYIEEHLLFPISVERSPSITCTLSTRISHKSASTPIECLQQLALPPVPSYKKLEVYNMITWSHRIHYRCRKLHFGPYKIQLLPSPTLHKTVLHKPLIRSQLRYDASLWHPESEVLILNPKFTFLFTKFF